ncbi:MAG: sulfatase-like hydrolase/transferase [Akkermansiaceae bacterium]|nr:sulfatase-like hydrolase/transferase [Akkermansiaceae bacterium]
MKPGIFLSLLALAVPVQAQTLLFSDNFNRGAYPDSHTPDGVPALLDIDQTTAGTGGQLAPVYQEPNDTLAGDENKTWIDAAGRLVLADVLNTSHAVVAGDLSDNVAVAAAGGLSMRFDLVAIHSANTADRYAGAGIVTDPGLTGDRAVRNQGAVWFGGYNNGDVAVFAGGSEVGRATVGGTNALDGATLEAEFSFADFHSGTSVSYEIFVTDPDVSGGVRTSVLSGGFAWGSDLTNSGAFLAVDGRASGEVIIDDFSASSLPLAGPAAVLTADPASVNAGDTSAPVTLHWHTFNAPAGATWEITADHPAGYDPPGSETGTPAVPSDAGSVDTIINGTQAPTTFTFTLRDSGAAVIATAQAVVTRKRPNVIVILVDDLGWADFGCYGSFIRTPNIDALAGSGVRFRNFYQAARCSPTRNAILTGLYTQQAAVSPGNPLPDLKAHGDAGANNVTIAEVLGAEGYRTYMAGKWHLGNDARSPRARGFDHVFGQGVNGQLGNTSDPFGYWTPGLYNLVDNATYPDSEFDPVGARYDTNDNDGDGKTRFHYTDATGDYAVDFIDHNAAQGDGAPFFLYLAFNAPHWPVQGPAELADRYTDIGDPTPDGLTTNGGLDGKDFVHFEDGWDTLRPQVFNRQLTHGAIDGSFTLSPKGDHPDGGWPGTGTPIDWGTSRAGNPIDDWNTLSAAQRADLARRMACYAASVEQVDANIGKVVTRLSQLGQLDNTLILLCSDNGANYEGGEFGNSSSSAYTPWDTADLPSMCQPQDANNSGYPRVNQGGAWANLSNTPFRMFKHYTHEGGIRTPAIIHWPDGTSPSAAGTWTDERGHLVDFMASAVAAAGATYPANFSGHAVAPMEGTPLLPVLGGQPLAPTGLRASGIGIEHEHNFAWFEGDWKLTRVNCSFSDGSETAFSLKLYNLADDPTELNDLAGVETAKLAEMLDHWIVWAQHVGVPAERIPGPVIPHSDPADLTVDLFTDTFNRPGHLDHDASTQGMGGTLVPSVLGAGTTYYDSFEPGPDVETAVVNGALMMAAGPNMTETALRHNFASGTTGGLIKAAGGFSVQLRVDLIQAASEDSRWAGFGVGLTDAEAQASREFSVTTAPLSFRGNGSGNGSADFFVELDALGQVKTFLNGTAGATVPVGSSTGTLMASFELSGGANGFQTGQPVTVRVFFDGAQLDLGGTGGTASFFWDQSDTCGIGISSRANTRTLVDHFAVRTLPLADALANENALQSGLSGTDSAPSADPDHDGDNNFVEWLKNGDPTVSDADARLLELVPGPAGEFHFAWIRRLDADAAGVDYRFRFSTDLQGWTEFAPDELSAVPYGGEHEVVQARVPAALLDDPSAPGQPRKRIFVRIEAGS